MDGMNVLLVILTFICVVLTAYVIWVSVRHNYTITMDVFNETKGKIKENKITFDTAKGKLKLEIAAPFNNSSIPLLKHALKASCANLVDWDWVFHTLQTQPTNTSTVRYTVPTSGKKIDITNMYGKFTEISVDLLSSQVAYLNPFSSKNLKVDAPLLYKLIKTAYSDEFSLKKNSKHTYAEQKDVTSKLYSLDRKITRLNKHMDRHNLVEKLTTFHTLLNLVHKQTQGKIHTVPIQTIRQTYTIHLDNILNDLDFLLEYQDAQTDVVVNELKESIDLLVSFFERYLTDTLSISSSTLQTIKDLNDI